VGRSQINETKRRRRDRVNLRRQNPTFSSAWIQLIVRPPYVMCFCDGNSATNILTAPENVLCFSLICDLPTTGDSPHLRYAKLTIQLNQIWSQRNPVKQLHRTCTIYPNAGNTEKNLRNKDEAFERTRGRNKEIKEANLAFLKFYKIKYWQLSNNYDNKGN